MRTKLASTVAAVEVAAEDTLAMSSLGDFNTDIGESTNAEDEDEDEDDEEEVEDESG
jgi:hypothetical protein